MSPLVCLFPAKFHTCCPAPPSTAPALKLGMQAKQSYPVNPAMWGGQVGPWAECSETSMFGHKAEDGQHGLPSATPTMTHSTLAKQNLVSGNPNSGGVQCSGQTEKELTCLGFQPCHTMAPDGTGSCAIAESGARLTKSNLLLRMIPACQQLNEFQ
eukprot:1141513-Pelagomonas_calceolata.AAC.2